MNKTAMSIKIGLGGSFTSPLRYPGGKGRLGPWLSRLILSNQIYGGTYVEPYAGGAGAAIYLLANRCVDHVVINDLDPLVYAFWWAVLNESEYFFELLDKTPVTMDSWYRQKEVHASPQNFNLTEVGFATFFLNRTNRSGILKGGVIGGKQQDGPYKLSARFNKYDLKSRIGNVASMSSRISLFNEDALKLIKNMKSELSKKSLIYLDPPYYNKGSQLYRNHYMPEDHELISSVVREVETPWIVTYDNCDVIKDLYRGCLSEEFSLYYSAAKQRSLATEIMFYDNLTLNGGAPKMTRCAI